MDYNQTSRWLWGQNLTHTITQTLEFYVEMLYLLSRGLYLDLCPPINRKETSGEALKLLVKPGSDRELYPEGQQSQVGSLTPPQHTHSHTQTNLTHISHNPPLLLRLSGSPNSSDAAKTQTRPLPSEKRKSADVCLWEREADIPVHINNTQPLQNK